MTLEFDAQAVSYTTPISSARHKSRQTSGQLHAQSRRYSPRQHHLFCSFSRVEATNPSHCSPFSMSNMLAAALLLWLISKTAVHSSRLDYRLSPPVGLTSWIPSSPRTASLKHRQMLLFGYAPLFLHETKRVLRYCTSLIAHAPSICACLGEISRDEG